MLKGLSQPLRPSYRRCRFPAERHFRSTSRGGGGDLWEHVIPHFSRFLQELELTPPQRADAETKGANIAQCLWNKFYGGDFNPNCYVNVGSYGKRTATRPPSDLDMLFLLPPTSHDTIILFGRMRRQRVRRNTQVEPDLH
jgi:hypothetical protein